MLYLLHEYIRGWLVAHDLYRFTQVLDRIEFRALSAAGIAFAFVWLLGPRTIGWLTRKKVGDAGLSDADALKGHASSKANVPTMGGILIVGAIGGAVLLVADISRFYVIAGLLVLLWHAVLGGFDDYLKLTAKMRVNSSRQGLYAWEKLIFQLGVGVLVGWFAYKQGTVVDVRAAEAARPATAATSVESAGAPQVKESPESDAAASSPESDVRHVLNLPFQRTYEPGGQSLNPNLIFLSMPVFIFIAMMMVAGMSNAVNITDGMDGLAAGISVAVSIGVFVLCLIAGNQVWAQSLLLPYVPEANELAVLAGATAGACLGFLWWNCWPAAVFMGDTGSLSLGGIIGYIAVVTRQELVVLLMCGIFLIEAGSSALQIAFFKITKGKRIFRIAPYHHNLHLQGLPEQKIVARFWIVSVILVVVALATLKMR
jgi:phospho-N-acetylmuramoyl-pentapeptide-transferase